MPSTTDTARRRRKRLAGLALLAHLAISLIHGVAHVSIPIPQPAWLQGFIVLVVYVLPVVGVGLLWRGQDRAGVAVFTGSLAVALLLGIVLHFVVPNPDHVGSVPAGAWKLPFQLTAVGVAVVDAIATGIGGWLWYRRGSEGRSTTPGSETARIDGVPGDSLDPATRLSYWFARREMGEVPEPLTLLAHHRGILLGYDSMELALERSSQVDERLTELAVLKSAMIIGCEFCIDIGAAIGRETGVTEAQLRALSDYEENDAFDPVEKLVLRYATAMTKTPADVPEDLFDDLRDHFDEAALVELTAAIAFENFRGRFNHAFGVASQDFVAGEYCPAPELAASTSASSHGGGSLDGRPRSP